MKKFLLKITILFLLIIILLSISLFCLPALNAKKSFLGALPEKHEMLTKASSPKIILVGGSNVSFGFNSQKIVETYHIPVINTGTTAQLGLKFILNDVKPYINKNDIIVLIIDYHCYEKAHESFYEGEEELIPILFDICPEGKTCIDFKQWIYLSQYLPHYAFSKIKDLFTNFNGSKSKIDLNDIMGRKSFNQYGDAYIHWNKPNIPFKSEDKCTGNEEINPKVIPYIQSFYKYVLAKQALLIILPPVVQATTYNNQSYIINKIETELKKSNLPIIATSARYKFADKYFFNHPYHLNKSGVDIHTDFVIEDLMRIVNKNPK